MSDPAKSAQELDPATIKEVSAMAAVIFWIALLVIIIIGG